MDDEVRSALKDAVARELVALGALALILFALGPGRVLVPAWIGKARAMMNRADPYERQARQFASEVSRWDHEQATASDRKPASGGPCGCG